MQQRIGNQFVCQVNTTDCEYTARNGQVCTVFRQLGKDEADILSTGLMYKACFPDGAVLNVYDELNINTLIMAPHKPLDQQIKTAGAKTTPSILQKTTKWQTR